MEIRKATQDDAAEIANVHTNTWREAYHGLLPKDLLDQRPLQFKNRFELWKKVAVDDSYITLVADAGDQYGVVGFISGKSGRDQEFSDYVEVYCIYLFEKFHGQGVGYSLLKEFFSLSSDIGFKKGYLWVLDDNPTIRFYERAGGQRTADIKNEEIGGQSVTEIRYIWEDIKLP